MKQTARKKGARSAVTAFHPQVLIEHDGQSAQVDKGLAALILALWQRGVHTIGSCQQEMGTPVAVAWIAVKTVTEAKRLQRLLGEQATWLIVPSAKHYAEASAASWKAGHTVRGMAGVAFPRTRIPAVLKAVKRLKAGVHPDCEA
jgi:hypothetical protein